MRINIHNKPYCRYIAYFLSFLSLLLIFTGEKVVAHDGASLVKIIKKVKPSIIAIGTYHPLSKPAVKYFGTGFVFSRSGYAITAEHVLSAINKNGEINNLYAFFPDTGNSIKVSAKVVIKNIKYDLAIIKLNGGGFDYLKLGDSSSVKEGQSIVLCGYPYGPVFGLYPTTHTGIISNISPMVIPVQNMSLLSNKMIKALTDPYYIFQLDCMAFPGNSGGPLFLPETGDVIGVLNSAFIKVTKENKQISTGISYAIPINYVRELIESIKKKR